MFSDRLERDGRMLMGIFSKGDLQAGAMTGVNTLEHRAAAGATRLAEHLLDVGMDGRGPFSSARRVAQVAMGEHHDTERAIDAIVRSHLRLAAVGGFVTGLGGFVVMPIALPANVLEFYLVATRMVAGIASTRGYDIGKPGLRSAVLLALVGADADDLLRKAGHIRTGPLANLAVQRLPGPVLLAVNKGVGFRLLTQFAKKSMEKFGRSVPLVGGLVGAGLDAYLLNRIAEHAREEFPPKVHLV
jgi:hypothetical protein